MTFPSHDPVWREVAEFIDHRYRTGDRIVANDIFWSRWDDIFRYAHLHVEPEASYDWVVIHKGELTRFPIEFLDSLQVRYRPVLANAVFVVWAAGQDLEPVVDDPHLTSFFGLVELRRAQPFEPQSVEGDLVPGRIFKFGSLDKASVRDRMDRFYEKGDYAYATLRDRVFVAELDRWLAIMGKGLDEADILDVGCGKGRVARVISRYRSLMEVDISPVAIAAVQKAGGSDSRRRAAVMDAESLEFKEHSFDAVTFIETAEHVHDLRAALSEAVRVLRPGGVLIMNSANSNSLHQRVIRKLGLPYCRTNYHHIHEPSWNETRSLLKDADCDIEQAEGIFLFPYWGVPGVDHSLRTINDNDPEIVETLRVLGERAGPELAYCFILRARKAGPAR